MDKKALLEYALFARKSLEEQITLSLNRLGIFKDKIAVANIVGDFTIIEGISSNYPKRIYELRKQIIEEYIKPLGFEPAVEEFAYTWFNRIVALRFLEVHDYLSHGFRVLTSKDGSREPEILGNLQFARFDLKLDDDVVVKFKESGDIEGLYRYVLFAQCKALSKTFPMLFEAHDNYMELLLPNNLLSDNSVISKISTIPEDDFKNDVEVIGWLYQYYVQSNRQEFRKAKVVTKQLVPTLSQVFTPDWIVRYMAENSIGRIWLESYPNSSLKHEMKYYVEDAKQTPEVQREVDKIKYHDVNPLDIKIIEPCCGSGHILVYAFDLLYKMYLEKGYSSKDIPGLILKNNLFGLDVDKRAAQLSQFALMMRARAIDSRFFNESRIVFPKVYEIIDSKHLISLNYQKFMEEFYFSKDAIDIAEYLVKTFENGKVIGSLLKISPKNYDLLLDEIALKKDFIANTLQFEFYDYGLPELKRLAEVAKILSSKYDVMITNPPYLGISKLEKDAKDYLIDNYPNSKSDMFAMFMEASYVKKNGFIAMVNPDSWMFLVSFEQLRKKIIKEQSIVNMVHLGMGAFDATVQTTSFVIRNTPVIDNGVYFRLVDSKDKENDFLSQKKSGGIMFSKISYNVLPNYMITYWISNGLINVFKKSKPLIQYATPKQGLATGDNNRFVRLWWEVSQDKSYYGATDTINAFYTGKKWFPYNKGGEYRKWFGNDYYVVNWENNGKQINDYSGSVIRNPKYYFNEAISWSKICSSTISFRYKPCGNIFDVAGCSIFSDSGMLTYLLGLLNSNLIMEILEFMAPTLNYEVGQISELPIIVADNSHIDDTVEINKKISKQDWDSFEESHDFKKHPLI